MVVSTQHATAQANLHNINRLACNARGDVLCDASREKQRSGLFERPIIAHNTRTFRPQIEQRTHAIWTKAVDEFCAFWQFFLHAEADDDVIRRYCSLAREARKSQEGVGAGESALAIKMARSC